MGYEEKMKALEAYLSELAEKDVAVAFSGGVDSSLLLHLCCKASRKIGTNVTAVTVHADLHPIGDVDIAQRVAMEAGARFELIHLHVLEEAGISMNPLDRCYRCKHYLFRKMKERAAEIGASYVIEGTNADDLNVYRPGIRALGELGILSPLAHFGITKAEVRQMAEEAGVSVAQRASMPCMATRFPYGTRLDFSLMTRLGEAEAWLRGEGYYNVRLRVHSNIVRMEIDGNDVVRLLQNRKEVVMKLKEMGFDYITLDLEGYRSGSMDIHIIKEERR